MKTNQWLITVTICLIFTSCASPIYFQIYKVTPPIEIKELESSLKYEDDYCVISYNLWGEEGDAGFSFFNKTDDNIFLNKEQCFFIVNGMAYNYFQNRIYTESKGAGISSTHYNPILNISTSGTVTSTTYSTSFYEEKIVCIPSKTGKIISEFNINPAFIRDCDLFKYPKTKQIKSKSYTKAESPLVFSNRIEVILGDTIDVIQYKNEFYVSEITNYPESEILKDVYPVVCGEKSFFSKTVNKFKSPERFYVRYKKEATDGYKH